MSQESKFQKVDWDTTHFGYGVARIDLAGIGNLVDLNQRLEYTRSCGIRLVYFFVPSEDFEANNLVKRAGGFLADEKITYLANVAGGLKLENTFNIVSYLGKPLNDRLMLLSFEAGVYSRYKLDSNFSHNEFIDLYTEWIRKSLNGEIARDVLVYKEDETEVGFITLGERDGRCNIGLIAVDKDYRRKGIGEKLVGEAFQKASEWGYGQLDVVTQKANISACRFYEKIGFEAESVVNIYHFWL